VDAVLKAVMRVASNVQVSLYRWTGGRIGGRTRGHPVLLLTVPGRRTGQLRSTGVLYFPFDDGYLVVGSAGGAKAEPDWFRNLRKAQRATVQMGPVTQQMTAEELHDPRRAEVFRDVVLPRAEFFADYVAKSGRQMPIALLRPVA
jgi:deazaflavin-dependent oxidoreductase (nitroreductase family)